MIISPHPMALHVVRTAGESGPILRCFGELSVVTAEVLRRELAILLPMGHPALTLNLSACSSVNVDGLQTILYTCKELRRQGSRLMLVVGSDRTAQPIEFTGIEQQVAEILRILEEMSLSPWDGPAPVPGLPAARGESAPG
jgi:anti-anti-sigma factor